MDLLEAYGDASDLYLARLDDVNVHRPLFTGDVYELLDGEQVVDTVIVLAHPCSIRGREAQLLEQVLVASVANAPDAPPPHKWASGHFRKMPLPELGGRFRAADFQTVHQVRTEELQSGRRIACLSEFGVNMLQQRFVFHLTRFVVPTRDLDSAFSHTFAEADLLEEWVETNHMQGVAATDASRSFDIAIRTSFVAGSHETMQDALRDPQKRSAVRKRLRRAAEDLSSAEGR